MKNLLKSETGIIYISDTHEVKGIMKQKTKNITCFELRQKYMQSMYFSDELEKQ